MELNKVVFGGLVIGCLAAAGGGAYLAARHNAQATDVAATPVDSAATAGAAPSAAPSVTASEGVVTPDPVAPAPVVASTPAIERPRTAPRPPARPDPRPAAVRPSAPSVASAPTSTAPQASPAPPAPTPAPASGGSMWEPRPTVQPAAPEAALPEPEPVAPPVPEYLELVVPADAVIGLQLETTVSSDVARVEDAVDARVTRDVRVAGRVAIPAGSLVRGTVSEVERGGKLRERARLGIKFHTVVLAGGDRLSLRTDAISREGASPGRESAAKIGGAAAGGAILGAILGGRKGAAIGGAVGGGAGTAAVMAGDRNTVTLPAGSTVSIRIQQPVSVTVEKE